MPLAVCWTLSTASRSNEIKPRLKPIFALFRFVAHSSIWPSFIQIFGVLHTQAEFVCQRCGLKDNANQNASRVIAQRGIQLLLEGTIQKKPVRRCGIGKEKQPGQEVSEVKASYDPDKTQRPSLNREVERPTKAFLSAVSPALPRDHAEHRAHLHFSVRRSSGRSLPV